MKSNLYWLLCFAGIAGLSGLGAAAQDALTLRQAIAQAIGQNPEAQAARAEIDSARAGVALRRTALLPRFEFTEDISRGDDPVYVFGALLRQNRFTQANFALDALNRPAPLGDFTSRFSGDWLLFDSLKSARQARAAGFTRKSAESQASAVDQKLIFDVVAAYQQALYAERRVRTARHEAETAAALRKSTDDRVRAGLAVESDRLAAEVNLAARQQALIAAEGDVDLAWATLRQAMGAPEFEPTALAPLEAREFPAGELNDEVASALAHRQDLDALGKAGQAQAAAVSAAKLSFGPQATAYGSWENDAASVGGANGSNWVAGVRIGIDLLPLSKRAELAQQKAAKVNLDARLEAYRQRVRVEVSQAHIQQRTALLSMQTAKAAVAQADESLRILRNRYEAGLATVTDLLRAEDAARESQTNYWRAVYGNSLAYAQLLFTTGTLTPDAAEALQ